MQKLASCCKTRLLIGLLIAALALIPAACTRRTTPSSADGSSAAASSAASTTALRGWTARETLEAFGQAWAAGNYQALYQLLAPVSQQAISEAAFSERYTRIAQQIGLSGLEVTPTGSTAELPADSLETYLSFSVRMSTVAGPLAVEGYSVKLVRSGPASQADWTIVWHDELIYPGLLPGERIEARKLWPQRGEILARDGEPLAINDQLLTIGIVPRTFAADQDKAIPRMARILGIASDVIRKKLAANTNPDWFVPIVTLPGDAAALTAELTAIDGVQYQVSEGRVYPAGKAAAHLIGYIGPITAEELARYKDRDYRETDKIGKMGLEQVLEPRLRGQTGAVIYRLNADSSAVLEEIARREPVNGETITLAIDLNVQQRLYAAIREDKGTAAALAPLTGEILALASAPAFDPNLLQTYVPDAVRAEWNNPANTFFTNRFKATYVPGSVFKLVTAAIGLKTGAIAPAEAFAINGRQWQPDDSWGAYKVTRVQDPGRPIDLQKAFIYSDNIYFAMAGLRIGATAMTDGAAAFGIGEALPIDYPFQVSQLANGTLQREILLADTSYGQGELLLSPLHVALIYSALANEGNILQPVLEYQGAVTPVVWKPQAIAASDVPLLRECLLQVVENPAGSGYTKKAARTPMLGKTGTAELKSSQNDPDGQENGWFVAMNVDQPRLVIAMMIESVEDRNGSHYVVPLVKDAMDDLLADG